MKLGLRFLFVFLFVCVGILFVLLLFFSQKVGS